MVEYHCNKKYKLRFAELKYVQSLRWLDFLYSKSLSLKCLPKCLKKGVSLNCIDLIVLWDTEWPDARFAETPYKMKENKKSSNKTIDYFDAMCYIFLAR